VLSESCPRGPFSSMTRRQASRMRTISNRCAEQYWTCPVSPPCFLEKALDTPALVSNVSLGTLLFMCFNIFFRFTQEVGMNAPNMVPADNKPKPRLLDQVREVIRVKHYSPRTEKAYVNWIKRFIFYHGTRHPAEMGAEEVRKFVSHLALDCRVAASTQNQAFNSLLFLYHEVLRIDLGEIVGAVRAKKPKRLPVVLTPEEVQAVLALLEGGDWLVCLLLYGAGLRLFEGLQLRVQDIDFARSELLIRDGKGQKDRVTMLPAKVQEALRQHLEIVRRQHEWDLAHPNRAGTAGASKCRDHHDLHPCNESRRPRRA